MAPAGVFRPLLALAQVLVYMYQLSSVIASSHKNCLTILHNIWLQGHELIMPSALFYIIGIKHHFVCINICWDLREALKPEPERLHHFPRGQADVNVSENHIHYCIKAFCHSKTLEEKLQKVHFSSTYNGAERHLTCERFEKATSRANDNCHEITFATMNVTDEVRFCDSPGMLLHKTAKPCINNM